MSSTSLVDGDKVETSGKDNEEKEEEEEEEEKDKENTEEEENTEEKMNETSEEPTTQAAEELNAEEISQEEEEVKPVEPEQESEDPAPPPPASEEQEEETPTAEEEKIEDVEEVSNENNEPLQEEPNEEEKEEEEEEELEIEEGTKEMELPPLDDSRTSVRSPIPERERYKVTLLHDLEKQHTCPQCNEAMRYPVKFDECDHRVCSSCFHEFLRVEPRCPVDQVPINKEKASLDHELNEKIMSLGAKCNNAEWGCKWEGLVKESQPHSEKCEFTDILCVNDCGAKFQRRFLQKHLDKDCPKKLISCAFCDERFYREEKKTHLEDCLKVPLPCPNKCDKKLTIPRDELDNHIETACPRTKIVCQFEEIGCPHRCSREKLSRHYKAGIIEHVRLLYDIVMKQGQRLDQHHELLQDHGALLETHQAQITDMERIARNQLIWRIDEYGRKFKEAKSGNTTTLFSPPFNTSKHGYRLCASLCLNGDGKGKGTHISAFISILRGAYDNLLKWPFSYRVTFYLLDQNSDPSLRKHIKFSIKPNPCADNEPFLGQPKMEKNASFGGAKFAKHEDAESRTYIKDDTIFLKISVDCDGSVEP